jgi:hypothetical protein
MIGDVPLLWWLLGGAVLLLPLVMAATFLLRRDSRDGDSWKKRWVPSKELSAPGHGYCRKCGKVGTLYFYETEHEAHQSFESTGFCSSCAPGN